jgi:phospholipase C
MTADQADRTAGTGTQLGAIAHIVVLMLENRSFDHMLGYLYRDANNVSPAGQPFEGLSGKESNVGADGTPVPVFPITPATPHAYFMPGADPGEGYAATNNQIFGPADRHDGRLRDGLRVLARLGGQGGLADRRGHPRL